MTISFEINGVLDQKEVLDTIKTSLDLTASYWRREAEKEEDPKYRNQFLELSAKYAELCEEVKSNK